MVLDQYFGLDNLVYENTESSWKYEHGFYHFCCEKINHLV